MILAWLMETLISVATIELVVLVYLALALSKLRSRVSYIEGSLRMARGNGNS